MLKVAGLRPVTRKLPSLSAIAPAMVTVDPLSLRETDARGCGVFEVSVILPRISKAGGAAEAAGAWAGAVAKGSASDVRKMALKNRGTVLSDWVGPSRLLPTSTAEYFRLQSTWTVTSGFQVVRFAGRLRRHRIVCFSRSVVG